jgi:hypothetical protein
MQLQYRGQVYNFQSAPFRSTPVVGPLSRKLQYRGIAYVANMTEPQDSPVPHAVNWRYQVH